MARTLRSLRALAVGRSLFRPTTLPAALLRLGFVQADPIRAPARAQDLILRHRVTGYAAGALERAYPGLDVEEDLLHAYGFVARPLWRLLHPRRAPRPTTLERRLLARVQREGATHPAALEAEFGDGRVVNAWGGTSKATTAALGRLHQRGALRVARRERGVRVYEAVAAAAAERDAGAPAERLRAIVRALVELLAPVAEPTLHALAAVVRRPLPPGADHRVAVRALVATGELERQVIGGQAYLWPAADAAAGAAVDEAPRVVRFLAPFDPVVWDRRRFEQLWGWAYRFEAYTPVAKRVRGYYALPLLWADQVIGWANATVEPGAGGGLRVELGFVGSRPRGRDFTREVDAEIARLEAFLGGAAPAP